MGQVENGDNIIRRVEFINDNEKSEQMTKPLFPINFPKNVRDSLERGTSNIISLIDSKNYPDVFVSVGKSGDLAFSGVERVVEKRGLAINQVVLENMGEIVWLYENTNKGNIDFETKFEEWAVNNTTAVKTILYTKDLLVNYIDLNKKDNYWVNLVVDWPEEEKGLLMASYITIKQALKEIERDKITKDRIKTKEKNITSVDFSPRKISLDKSRIDYSVITDINWVYKVSEKIAKDLRIPPKKIGSYYLTEYVYGMLLGVDNLELLGHKIVDEARQAKEPREIENPTDLLEEIYGRKALTSLREKLKQKIGEIGDNIKFIS